MLWGGNNAGFLINIVFQLICGILIGIFTLFLLMMIEKSKKVFILSTCLIYLCPAIMSFSNQLVPATVRILSAIGLITTRIIFGIIVGIILWKEQKSNNGVRQTST